MVTIPEYKQMIPAEGYCAVYFRDKAGDDGLLFYTDPLAVWVLLEYPDGTTEIGGLSSEDITEKYDGWTDDTFVCYARLDEIKIDPDKINRRAESARTLRRQLRTAGGVD